MTTIPNHIKNSVCKQKSRTNQNPQNHQVNQSSSEMIQVNSPPYTKERQKDAFQILLQGNNTTISPSDRKRLGSQCPQTALMGLPRQILIFQSLFSSKSIDAPPDHQKTNQNLPKTQAQIIQSKSQLKCNCKKNRCKNKCCPCLKSGNCCSKQCSCINQCQNKEENIQLKNVRAENLAQKLSTTMTKCTCKNTDCSKKHCQCFKIGQACNELCQCIGCFNDCQKTTIKRPTRSSFNKRVSND